MPTSSRALTSVHALLSSSHLSPSFIEAPSCPSSNVSSSGPPLLIPTSSITSCHWLCTTGYRDGFTFISVIVHYYRLTHTEDRTPRKWELCLSLLAIFPQSPAELLEHRCPAAICWVGVSEWAPTPLNLSRQQAGLLCFLPCLSSFAFTLSFSPSLSFLIAFF